MIDKGSEGDVMKQKYERTRKTKKILALAAAILALSVTALSPAAAEQETDKAAKAENRKPPETEAVAAEAEAKVHLDYAYNLVGASSEHSWVCLCDGMSKGFGCPWLTINLDKDIEFSGSEGAEVYVGTSGILHLALTDTASGDEVNPSELLFMEEEPIDYTLTAEHYDWDLNLIDTTPLGNITERDAQVYFDTFDSAISSEVAAIGASRYGDASFLTPQDVDGDAVLYGLSGEELVRYPGTDASGIMASMSSDGKILVVTSLGSEIWTDIFTVGTAA